ncbi:CPCC family cysteine-rich protein [Tundrisphaera sp. TA3]|uniref:CPCC family cysteine-rich protein n=1 Tax=Tundrisphaera sp. TA3 TaxID=3435775 RepID=UPI003EBE5A81
MQICTCKYDPTQTHPDDAGGANRVSLREAQQNFLRFGAIAELYQDMSEPPSPQERRDPDWRPIDPSPQPSPETRDQDVI